MKEKYLLIPVLAILTMLFVLPKTAFAADLKKIGASCLINSECWTQNCMQSIASNVSAGKYCACDSNDSCQEYSDDPGARWKCVDMDQMLQTDTGYVSPELQALKDKSHGLNYCHSATLGDKFAINNNAFVPAKPDTTKKDVLKIIAPKLSLPIPSLPVWSSYEMQPGEPINIPWLADYIIAIYKYAIVIGSVLAVVAVMIGGILYLTAGGIPSNIERAKSIILGSLTGLIILICSHLVLNAINPELVNLKSLTIETVKPAVFEFDIESTDGINITGGSPFGILDTSSTCTPASIINKATYLSGQKICQGACHCAATASRILYMAGCNIEGSTGAGGLRKNLEQAGWITKPCTAYEATSTPVGYVYVSGHGLISIGDGQTVESGTDITKCWQNSNVKNICKVPRPDGTYSVGDALCIKTNNECPKSTADAVGNDSCNYCAKIPGEEPKNGRFSAGYGGSSNCSGNQCIYKTSMSVWRNRYSSCTITFPQAWEDSGTTHQGPTFTR